MIRSHHACDHLQAHAISRINNAVKEKAIQYVCHEAISKIDIQL